MSVRVDLRVPMPARLEELATFAAACEAAGFDGIGVHDHPEAGLDAYVGLAAAATRTTRIGLYVAVTNLETRHPLVIASIAGSMWQVAPGRFRLVVGAGNVGVRQVGQGPTGSERLGTGARAIRSLLRGAAVSFGGADPISLRSIPDEAPRLSIACAGPRGFAQALADADGAFLLAGLDDRVGSWIRERVMGTPGFDVIRVIPIHLTRSMGEGRRWFARWWETLHASPRPSDKWIIRSDASWTRAVDREPAAGHQLRRTSDPDALAERIGIFGPADYVRDRLATLTESQALRHVYLWTAHLTHGARGSEAFALPHREVDALGPILPSLRSAP